MVHFPAPARSPLSFAIAFEVFNSRGNLGQQLGSEKCHFVSLPFAGDVSFTPAFIITLFAFICFVFQVNCHYLVFYSSFLRAGEDVLM